MARYFIWDWGVTVARPRAAPDRVYVRFGMWDAGRPSSNYATGEREAGLSVYPGVLLPDGGVDLAEDADVDHRRPQYRP